MKPTICKPAKAKYFGPNRAKIILKRGFVSKTANSDKTPQDIFEKRAAIIAVIRAILS